MTSKVLMTLAAATTLAIAGCAKKPPQTLPPDATGGAGGGNGGDAGDGYAAPSGPGSQADFISKITSDRIYFALDRFDVDPQYRATLESQAAWLAQYPRVRIIVEGHADERGTRDYNLALGERRANATKNYLVALGVDPARITTISYGKERPADPGSTQAAWAKNRRAVTVTLQR